MSDMLSIKGFPTGWVKTELGDLCEVVRGGSPRPMGSPKYFNGDIPFIKISDVTKIKTKNIFDSDTKVNEAGSKKSRLLPKGSLILSNSGTICVPKFLGVDACIHDGFVSFLNLHNAISKEYLFHFFHFIRPYIIQKYKQGVTQVNLNTKIVSEFELLLPSTEEQHQIVAKIEELFSELENGIENLKKAREQLKTYRQAVLKYAFEGKLTKEWRARQVQAGTPPEPAEKLLERIRKERGKHYKKQVGDWQKACELAEAESKKKPAKPKKPKELPPLTDAELKELPELPEGWGWIRFGQVVNDLKRGPFGSAIKKEYFVPNGIKVYEQKNAIYKSENIGDYFISGEKFKELSGFVVNAGDYIVSCSGTIGRIFRLPKNSAKGIINQALLRIKISEKLLDHNFFQNLFESTYFQLKILKDTKGSAMVNLAGIKELELVPFAYCSLKEQNAIAQEIESRLSVCDQLEQTIEDNLKKAEALRRSILKKAFEGELTREWRKKNPELISGENSAEKLLEKIKAEKALAAGQKKSGSKKMKKK